MLPSVSGTSEAGDNGRTPFHFSRNLCEPLMLKALIFDFGQTLADSANGFRTAEKQVQDVLFHDIGSLEHPDFLSRYRQIRKAFHDRSDFSRKEMWRRLYAQLGMEPDARLLEQWERNYWDTVEVETKLFPETLTVLEQLASRYSLAVITNTQGCRGTTSARHRLGRFPGLEKHLKVTIVAGEGGVPPKPDPLPFRLCLERLDAKPAEAVFVGDDWRIDIAGARNAGIRPVWLKHHSVARSWPEVDDNAPVITGLDSLLSVENLISEK